MPQSLAEDPSPAWLPLGKKSPAFSIERSVRELRPDGFWTSDDLGHQKQLFVRPELFRQFMKPYYARIGAVCREQGVHWWLHSCDNSTGIVGDLAEAGLDVFHPVQKGTAVCRVRCARDWSTIRRRL